MSASGQEIESKFYVKDLDRIAIRLQNLRAKVVQGRTFERNLRFDLADGSLRRTQRVLRLRKDEGAVLTYKGPGTFQDGIRAREELEVTVSDFAAAEQILTALGYQVVLIYEKYRRTYGLGSGLVMLDELPYGNFAEIEAEHADAIPTIAGQLGLALEASICDSYQSLFERVHAALGLTFRDLSFENFENIGVTPALLGVTPAD